MAIVLSCVSCNLVQSGREHLPVISEGAIDLSRWALSTHAPLALTGDWQFYPSEFLHASSLKGRKKGAPPPISVKAPGSWNDALARPGIPGERSGHGFGTLVLQLKVPPGHDLALFNPWAGSAYTLYCGDRELAKAGEPGENAATTTPYSGPAYASMARCADTTLYWQIANFHHHYGGPRNTWQIGRAIDIARSRLYQDMITVAFGAICLVIALFYLGIWVINPANPRYLVFAGLSLSCLLVRLAAEKFPQRLSDSNLYDFQFRLEFIATVVCAFLVLAAVRALIPHRFSRPAAWLSGIATAILVTHISLTDVAEFSRIVAPLMLYYFLILIGGLVLSVNAIYRKQDHGLTVFVALLTVLGVALHDILVLRGHLPGPRFGALGFFAMIITQIVISIRFFFRTKRLEAESRSNLEERLKLQDSTLRRQQSLLAAGSDMWIISDPAQMGQILQVSENTCKALGYTQAELQGMRIKDIETEFPVWTVFEWIVHTAAIRESRQNTVIEGTWKRKDGSQFPVSISVSLHNWENKEYMVGFIRDISALRESQVKHRESTALLRLIADSVPGPVCYVDAEGKYKYVNAKFEEWFGVKKTDIVGRTPRQVLPQDLYAEIEPNFAEAFVGKTVHREVEFKNRSGEIRFLRANHLPHRDDDGNIAGAFGMAFDITDLVSTGRKLTASEERWLTLFESSPLPSFIWTKRNDEWTLTGFNKAGVEYTSGKVEGFIGVSAAKMYADSPEILAAFAECERVGFARQSNIPYRVRSTGDDKLVSVMYTAMPGDQILIRVEDVTEKFNARKLIDQREGELRALIDSLPVMIGYWDEKLRNRFANKAYESWFGIDAQKIPEMHMRDVLGEERFQLNLPYIEGVLKGVPQSFEREIPAPDGSFIRYSSAQYVPDIRDGRVQGFYIIVADISEQKRIQAKLQSLLVEKETLLAEVHHRVKNNLQVITSLISLQGNIIKDQQAVAQLTSLSLRIRVMGQLHTMLYQSNNVGRVDMDKYLRSIVDQALLINNFSAKRIHLVVEIGNIHLNMETALPIGLIVNEIVSNSQKYAFADTAEPEVKLHLHTVGEDMVLEISDNGTGIKEEAEGGKTLGLRLIRLLVQQLHGKMSVASHLGTSYRIEFREQHKEDTRWRSNVS